MKTLTKEIFIKRSQGIHIDENGNYKYDYSKVIYINNATKVEIKCIKCNNFFLQIPNSHLLGRGCSQCGIKAMKIKHSINLNEFIAKASLIHENKYDYKLTIYKNSQTKIKIICPIKEHGIFEQTPHSHTVNNTGCPKCANAKNGIAITKDLTGKKFGKLTVIKFFNRRGKYKVLHYECLCECGNTTIVSANCLRGGSTKTCGCSKIYSDRSEALWTRIYNVSVKYAKKERGIGCSLTKEEFINLSQQPCNYCGVKHSLIKKDKFFNDNNTFIKYNGLDRVDSNGDYELNNVVPCCRACNIAKHTMTQEEFKQWVIRIYHYYIEKIKLIE